MAAPRAKRRPHNVGQLPSTHPATARIGTLAAVFLLSAVSLAWEITLTRLASATLSYHFAFVAVSLAVGGLGLGAVLVFATSARSAHYFAAWCALGTGLLFLLTPLLIPAVTNQASLGQLVWLSLPPFVAVGAALTWLFRAAPEDASRLYGADLLGAGVGAIATIVGLNALGPFGMIFLLGGASAIAAWFLARDAVPSTREQRSGDRRLRWREPAVLASLLLCVSVAGTIIQSGWAPLSIDYRSMSGAPPDKTIVPVLRDATQHARIVDTRWDAFARTDVLTTADPSQRLIFTDGGAGTFMQRWDGRLGSQQSLLSDLETVPFLLGPHQNVLVIGAGGGIDVLRALVAGANHVTAVDWNRSAVAAVRSEKIYNGNILDRPNVTTVIDDGRHFLAHSTQKYDTILLNLVYTGTAEGTSNALAESYVFTTEAFRSYLSHLTGRGRIGIISHQALEGLRSFTTGVEAFHQDGASYTDVLQRSALLMTTNQTPQSRPTLTIIQREPFNRRELTYLRARGTGDLNLTPLYVPNFYRGSFHKLADGTQTLSQFLQGSDYNVSPTSDDQPFFFDLNFGWPDGLATALRYAISLIAGVVVLALVLRLPWRPRAVDGSTRSSPITVCLLGLYMAMLGTGFMCIEIPLIQRFILVLGQPTIALAVVLATLLVAGGVGSLLAGVLFTGRVPLWVVPLAVMLLALLARFLLPTMQSGLLSLSPTVAVVASVCILTPIGLVLGMPLPLGLRLAGQVSSDDVALFWSVNAVFSVLGSVIAALVAIQLGFGTALVVGAACYGAGAVALFLVTVFSVRSVPVASRNQSALVRGHT